MADKEKFSEAYIGNPLCFDCIHYHLNNGEGTIGCRAFPTEIPEEAQHGHNHLNVLPGQVGNYVFQEAKFEELSPFAKYLRKLQNKTPE